VEIIGHVLADPLNGLLGVRVGKFSSLDDKDPFGAAHKAYPPFLYIYTGVAGLGMAFEERMFERTVS